MPEGAAFGKQPWLAICQPGRTWRKFHPRRQKRDRLWSLSSCRKTTLSRGNPFLPAYAGQKFLPPGGCGSLLLLRPSQRACKRQTAAPFIAVSQISIARRSALVNLDGGPSSASLVSAADSSSASLSCMCPVHPHMSAGQDFFDSPTPPSFRLGKAGALFGVYGLFRRIPMLPGRRPGRRRCRRGCRWNGLRSAGARRLRFG